MVKKNFRIEVEAYYFDIWVRTMIAQKFKATALLNLMLQKGNNDNNLS